MELYNGWQPVINQLRDTYGDRVHPLGRLEINLPLARVRMTLRDRNDEELEGAYRIHPRMPSIEVWPDVKTAEESMVIRNKREDSIVDRIDLQDKLRAAKEAVMEARLRGEPPKQEDVDFIDGARLRPTFPGKTITIQPSRIITLKEIEEAVNSARRISGESNRSRYKPLEIPLRHGAPVRIMSSIPVILVVEFR